MLRPMLRPALVLAFLAACGPTGRGHDQGDDDDTPTIDAATTAADADPGASDGALAVDAGRPDARSVPDAAPQFDLVTQTISDSASSGTPDSYQFEVLPGSPFEAHVSGGGAGPWTLNLSNGTTTGIYCTGSPDCTATIPAGVDLVLLTIVTEDIGFYSVQVTWAPPP
jgi:hypothetical protein